MGRGNDTNPQAALRPASFLEEHFGVFADRVLPGPVLDLACGDGHNGIFLASKGLPVVCCDRSPDALEGARKLAADQEVTIELVEADLEEEGVNPLPEDSYGGILVFRYLHRPLIPCIRKALKRGAVLMYETFTIDQPWFGKPHNPEFLLKPGELRAWFDDWEIIACFEGIQESPRRAISQILCRKPPLKAIP